MFTAPRPRFRSLGALALAALVVAASGCTNRPPVRERLADHGRAPAAAHAPADVPGAVPAEGTIMAADLRAHVTYLASDALAGRATGTEGCDTAARYVAGRFADLGLSPAVGGNQPAPAADSGASRYYQFFEVNTGVQLGATNACILRTEREGGMMRGWKSLSLAREFTPLSFSASGRCTGRLVFAGYGITAQAHGYDDYAAVDPQGAVVVALHGYPGRADGKAPFGPETTFHGDARFKATNARNHGAVGLILVTGRRDVAGDAKDQLPAVRTQNIGGDAGMPVVQMTAAVFDQLLKVFDRSLEQAQLAIDQALQPASFSLGKVEAGIAVELLTERRRVANVAALLRGADPAHRDECVVIGAHYDHLGLGGAGSLAPDQIGQVHNGADDNASGTAGLLEMAEAFSRARPGPARSVLFIAFSGEEMGLLGSAHYVKEPLLPLDKTVAMVNLDMVGRLRDDKLIVGGVDTGSGLRDLVNEKAGPLGLSVAGSGDGFGASDHASFYGKKVPVLFFFTGVHDDYHRPTDDVEKVNFPGAEKVVRLAYRCSWKLASGGARPEYQETTNPHLRAAAGAGSGFGAYLGTVPDYTQSEKGGVTLQAVRPGSPAEAAGLKAGDVIVAFAGAPIDNVYDYTYALREHKPGETVALTVKRGGESLTLTARLAQRP